MISYRPRNHSRSMAGSSRSRAVQPVVPGTKGREDVAAEVDALIILRRRMVGSTRARVILSEVQELALRPATSGPARSLALAFPAAESPPDAAGNDL